MTTRPYLARVRATLRRRASFRNPIPWCSFALTQDNKIMSFSLPWNASTLATSISYNGIKRRGWYHDCVCSDGRPIFNTAEGRYMYIMWHTWTIMWRTWYSRWLIVPWNCMCCTTCALWPSYGVMIPIWSGLIPHFINFVTSFSIPSASVLCVCVVCVWVCVWVGVCVCVCD